MLGAKKKAPARGAGAGVGGRFGLSPTGQAWGEAGAFTGS